MHFCIMSIALLNKYFPDLSSTQQAQFEALDGLYKSWNEKVNLISRKDIDELYERHVLHSLAIAKVCQFKPNTRILDVGTGGGFPGIPLAIMFPEADLVLVDSTGKKIKVVNEVVKALGLKNVEAAHLRGEDAPGEYDFIVSRAVTKMKPFYRWVKNKISPSSFNDIPNGIIYLKGGDLTEEMQQFGKPCEVLELKDFFEEEYFETKKVVYT
jgi:16S rRNA (guanine527-N7)-methyltransferase